MMMPRCANCRRTSMSYRIVLLLFLCVFGLGTGVGSAQTEPVLPAGFHDLPVTDVAQPTALAFAPDGRLLITSQSGRLWVYRDGTLLDTPALDLRSRLCSNSERGLLGIAVDPDVASNRFIYLY